MKSLASALPELGEPTIVRVQTEVPELSQRAMSLVVTNEETLAEASSITSAIKSAQKFVKGLFAKPIQKQKDSLDELKSLEKFFLDPLARGESRMRDQMETFELQRREERRKEQLRLEKIAADKQVDEQLDKAIRAENIGRATGDEHYLKVADQILEQPVRPTPVVVKSAKLAETTFADEISVDVVDVKALCAAVAAGKVLAGAVTPHAGWLKRHAEQMGDAYDVPGTVRKVGVRTIVRS